MRPLRPLSREEVRGLDVLAAEELGLSTLILMENAGRGAAEWLRQRFGRGRVAVVCGPGNNGGDGAVLARHWDAVGDPVHVVWLVPAERLAPDAATQHDILRRSGISQEHFDAGVPGAAEALAAVLAETDFVVDAVLGTGLTRPVEGVFALAVESINRSGKPVLALDLPSGLDADTGQPLGVAVRAAATATFVAPKLGFGAEEARAYVGEVHVVSIGLPRIALQPFFEAQAEERTP